MDVGLSSGQDGMPAAGRAIPSGRRTSVRVVGSADEAQRRDATDRAAGGGRLIATCRHHGDTEFIRRRDGGSPRCLRCRSEQVTRWRRRLKATLVAEAGGACRMCGYSRSPVALQFHHVDPATKAFSLSDEGVTRSLARARAEAAKCVLLCANCHAEVEAGIATLRRAAPSSPG